MKGMPNNSNYNSTYNYNSTGTSNKQRLVKSSSFVAVGNARASEPRR